MNEKQFTLLRDSLLAKHLIIEKYSATINESLENHLCSFADMMLDVDMSNTTVNQTYNSIQLCEYGEDSDTVFFAIEIRNINYTARTTELYLVTKNNDTIYSDTITVDLVLEVE